MKRELTAKVETHKCFLLKFFKLDMADLERFFETVGNKTKFDVANLLIGFSLVNSFITGRWTSDLLAEAKAR